MGSSGLVFGACFALAWCMCIVGFRVFVVRTSRVIVLWIVIVLFVLGACFVDLTDLCMLLGGFMSALRMFFDDNVHFFELQVRVGATCVHFERLLERYLHCVCCQQSVA